MPKSKLKASELEHSNLIDLEQPEAFLKNLQNHQPGVLSIYPTSAKTGADVGQLFQTLAMHLY